VWLVFDKTGLQSISIRSVQGRRHHRRRQPVTAGKRPGHPHSPEPAADAVAGKRPARGGIEWTLTFADRVAAPPLPLMVLRQHHRSRARQCQRAAGEPRPVVQTGRSRRRRYAAGGHRAAAGRGFIKRQDFVELSLLESGHGVVVHPNSDDISAEVGSDKGNARPAGRTDIVIADVAAERATAAVRPLFDAIEWRKNQEENFLPRLDALIRAAGTAEPEQKTLGAARSRQFLHGARDCIRRRAGHQPDLLRDQAGQRRGCRDDGACGGLYPDRPFPIAG